MSTYIIYLLYDINANSTQLKSINCHHCREIIVERHYRGRTSRSLGDYFWDEVKKVRDPRDTPVIVSTSTHCMVHVFHNGLFFVGVVRTIYTRCYL